jgi:hypothetical protein
MRTFLLLLGILSFNCLNAQFRYNDTLFLERCWIYSDTGYHAIYFENDKKSVFYKYLSDFSIDKWDSTELLMPARKLIQHVKSNALKSFPLKWNLLYKYQGKYVVYSPSERGEDFKLDISDSLLIFYFMEKAIEPVISFNRSEYVFTIRSKGIHSKKISITNIYIIDSKKQIAVVEMSFSNDAVFYALMIPAERITEYPFIVNYCVTDKTDEVEFDLIDYQRLINDFKRKH